ncbi:MAG: RluA family pseudouridine synthase [Gemmatimonadaceae bacterium]|nr:RluA family pseudouridine synthase [Gemmatimonadaceae bacterium]
MIRFTPAPSPADVPARFPSPFDRAAVHPLARRAAQETMAQLASPAAAQWQLDAPGNGKMFGVLVVQARDGAAGYLRAFSGMLAGQWHHEGWAPPAFDAAERDAIWVAGDAEMRALASAREQVVLGGDPVAVAAFDASRAARSRDLLPRIQESYRFTNARGELRLLRDLFAPALPPGGAGDCAAPKLLAQAYTCGLHPLALAEFWWGAPPKSADRRAASFYPACHGKCGPILAHMLRGLHADEPPVFGTAAVDAAHPRTVYEDAHLLVVDKPSGLLSVPGRSARLQDCVLTRLRARYPDVTGQIVVHRLDLDTSGLLLAAKDAATFSALQRLFSLRAIDKRYVAVVDGDVRGDSGEIALPLRLDIDDRPRHIHDPESGKPALTEWRVLERHAGRTRVQFTPHTGRTHQLRVHAAHPLGLDAPIVGDRLYGREAPAEGERLLLHAERLAFLHPVTGAAVVVESPTPF